MASPHPLSAAALFSLKGYVAVVTGGGTGVGLMIAQTLAANGAKVYITGRRVEVLETSAHVHGAPERLGASGGGIVPLAMDVTSKESVRATVAKITEKEGFVNILVNNAGVWGGRPTASPKDGPEAFSEAMMAEEKEDNWQKSFDINVTSQYFVTAAFLPLLAKAVSGPTGKVGSVINNCSVGGCLRMSQNRQFSYNASKAAFIHLTRQLAFELSHEQVNVRVNGLALGYFPSEMTTGESNGENESTASNEQFGKFLESMGGRILNRMGTPQELASVVLMLATNDFVWGTVTIVDGGFTLALPGNM
ncbi:NAD(P)-binding protein [Annulohypoxylon maeteangense]|uniref:NAD(P)-binding protein n=1 Tax=Annulohypoxylon maeteangense TaxID=1927788 RepID=UPI002007374C|nr:NAD(P)-binding protein [Annulohypoxylon maeteangense]KAI0886598.1 NAD(P)-binding protein [Annulohypoxylon maeteangense]